MTAYSGVKRAKLRAGQWIVISGAGGGLGHLALQYAKVMVVMVSGHKFLPCMADTSQGLRVIAIDEGQAKEELCKKLGAEAFIDFGKVKDISAEVKRITSHGAHGVVVTAYVRDAYEIAASLLRPNGTLVVVGLPHDASIKVSETPSNLAFGCLNIAGSLVGTFKEVDECLDFTARGLVHVSVNHNLLKYHAEDDEKPILTTGKLEEVDKYIELMAAGKVAGRVSLKCS